MKRQMITEVLDKSRLTVPFVLRAGGPSSCDEAPYRDVPTCEDPLPAAVMIDSMGHAFEGQTRITLVESETHDDK
jgi:hypothetical protein